MKIRWPLVRRRTAEAMVERERESWRIREADLTRLLEDERKKTADIQRRFSEWLREQYETPQIQTASRPAKSWSFPLAKKEIPSDQFAVRSEVAVAVDYSVTVKMEQLMVSLWLGLSPKCCPELVAHQIGRLVEEAVLTRWRHQSALLNRA